MKVLMFLHDAYGGHGGISRNNRDVLDALVYDSRVERIVALPRIAGDGSDPVPQKVDWRVGGLVVAIRIGPCRGVRHRLRHRALI